MITPPAIVYVAAYSGSITSYSVTPERRLAPGPSALVEGGSAGVSWLAVETQAKRIYAVDERAPGRVATFAMEPDGVLQPLGEAVWSGGDGPVSLAIGDGSLFVANYTSGTVTALPMDKRGVPQPPRDQDIVHLPKAAPGPVSARQDHPYAHQVVYVARTTMLYVVDLGSDAIVRFKVSPSGLRIVGRTSMPAGSGPRHLVIHGGDAYVACELDSTVIHLRVEQSGELTPTGERLALAPDAEAPSVPNTIENALTAGEIAMDPEGAFVYVSTRGDAAEDHITIFARDSQNGKLTFQRWVGTGGRSPRHFSLSRDADARFLVAANQLSENVVLFVRHAATGELQRIDTYANAGKVAYAGFAWIPTL